MNEKLSLQIKRDCLLLEPPIYSVADLARAIGLTRQQVSSVIHGNAKGYNTRKKIEEFMRKSYNWD